MSGFEGIGGTPLPKFPLNARVWGYNLKRKGETLQLRQKEIQERTYPAPRSLFSLKMLRIHAHCFFQDRNQPYQDENGDNCKL